MPSLFRALRSAPRASSVSTISGRGHWTGGAVGKLLEALAVVNKPLAEIVDELPRNPTGKVLKRVLAGDDSGRTSSSDGSESQVK